MDLQQMPVRLVAMTTAITAPRRPAADRMATS